MSESLNHSFNLFETKFLFSVWNQNSWFAIYPELCSCNASTHCVQ